jgi:hypothetical protein
MEMIKKIGFSVLVFIITAIVVSLIVGLPTMFLWNWLMPTLFRVQKISFIQVVGFTLLCSILFKRDTFTKD